MRRSLVLALAAAVCLIVAGPAMAKPLVVLSLTSHNDAQMDTTAIDFVAEADEMPTWLSSTLQLFAQGRGVAGLDASRPWGAAVELTNGKLAAYAFIPIKDLETLSWELYEHIDSTTEVSYGIYKVTGTEKGKELYAKELGGWLYVSDCPECLANVPYSPAKLIDGMNKDYDVALRLSLKNVPADHGKKILAGLDKTIGKVLRKKLSDDTMNILGKAAFHIDEVTLGWSEK